MPRRSPTIPPGLTPFAWVVAVGRYDSPSVIVHEVYRDFDDAVHASDSPDLVLGLLANWSSAPPPAPGTRLKVVHEYPGGKMGFYPYYMARRNPPTAREFHLSDCPVLDSEEEWNDEDVAVAMDWALAHGYEDADGNEETRAHYEAERPKWTDYEPEHVREALENDVDPFEWKPGVEAEFEYAGMGDYYGGHATRAGQALLYTSYGFGSTLADVVEGWMGELTMGFPGEEDPRWAGLSDEQIKEALEGLFIEPYNPDAIFDEDMDEPEDDEDEFDESPVAIVLLTVTTSGLKDG